MSDFVLCIDDSAELLFLEEAICRIAGIEARCSTNGKEAIESVDSDNVPLAIICDLHMPVMDGRSFLEERSRVPYLARVPFVLCSSNNEEARKVANQHGVSFIGKGRGFVAAIERTVRELKA